MTPLAYLASITGIILGLSGFPQVIKIFKRKSAKDISLLTILIAEVGTIIWIFYGFELNNFSIWFSNLLGFVTTTLILIGFYLYGRK